MPQIVIFFVIAIFVINVIAKANQQKRRQEAQRQSAQRNVRQQEELAAAEEARRRAVEAGRRSAGLSPTVRPSVQPGASGWHCVCGRDNRSGSAFCVKCGRKREEGATGSLEYVSTEGEALRGDTEGYSTEGRGLDGTLVAAKPSLRHVVRPVTESRHAHTEESMEGREAECAEDYDQQDSYEQTGRDAYALDAEARELPFGIRLADKGDVLRGLVYAEILAKPRALRGR